MDIKNAIVKKVVYTEDDLVLFQNTEFKKGIKCRNIFCDGGRWSITAKDITAENVIVGNVEGENIYAVNMSVWNIYVKDICVYNVDAVSIHASYVNAVNIVVESIDADKILTKDISAGVINAGDINADVITCDKRIKKNETNRTFAKVFVDGFSNLKGKEWVV